MQSLMGAGYFSWEALLPVVIQESKILLSCSSILKSLSLSAAKMGMKGIEGWGTWRSPVSFCLKGIPITPAPLPPSPVRFQSKVSLN